mmetsp:Transcript_33596/g.68116  ORF Transcript_33596/g.68116 Transcript_33596/m.68116 type:complete len:109 (-) Transcript_33596:41-367(-)
MSVLACGEGRSFGRLVSWSSKRTAALEKCESLRSQQSTVFPQEPSQGDASLSHCMATIARNQGKVPNRSEGLEAPIARDAAMTKVETGLAVNERYLLSDTAESKDPLF